MMGTLLRRAGALLFVIAVTAGTYFGIRARYGAYDDVYRVKVDLPRAGQLMREGADVRQRGVLVGTVTDIQLVDRHAQLTLEIQPDYRIPSQAEAFVDLKTLLGDKFVDIRFDSYAPPFLEDGARMEGHVGPELEDVLQNGVTVLESIDPADAATVVSELAQGARGHGEDIARGLQANAELSTIFAQTLKPQLKGLHAFHVIFDELKDRGLDLNAMADAINVGVPVYASSQAQRDFRRALVALVPMTDDLADLLILEREDWDRMMDSGDIVLQAIADRPQGLHDLVHGVYRYVFKLGGDAPKVGDGREMAAFANFIGGESEGGEHGKSGGEELVAAIQNLCGLLPASKSSQMPICAVVGP